MPSFNKLLFKRKDRLLTGFTLIELLIVIAIIVILSAIILPNYRAAASQFTLERSAYKLAQDIRRAAEMAMSAKECPKKCPIGTETDCSCADQVPSGYGVYIEAGPGVSTYILYADTQGNEFYTPADDEIEELQLEKGVIIQNINTSSDKVGIVFKPPSPTVMIKWDESMGEVDKVIITLVLESDLAKTKTITINKAGLIDVE